MTTAYAARVAFSLSPYLGRNDFGAKDCRAENEEPRCRIVNPRIVDVDDTFFVAEMNLDGVQTVI
jgi:hypothetical protein